MSKRYTGGIVSATKPTTSGGELGSASGLWEIEQQGRLQAAGLWPIPYVPKYVEDVFGTYLYTGAFTYRSINTGFDFGGTAISLAGLTVTNLGGAFSGSYPMANLSDGGLETSNASNMGFVPSASGYMDIYVDLGVAQVVTSYSIAPQGTAGSASYNNPTAFVVLASNNASTWTTIATFSSISSGYPDWSPGSFRQFSFSNSTAYRYWRLQNTTFGSGNAGVGISEWQLNLSSGSGKAGMIWIKNRTNPYNNVLFDTVRGAQNRIRTNTTETQATVTSSVVSFNANGVTLGGDVDVNHGGSNIVAFNFRKQAKFFDVVSYTGNGTTQAISHSLGATVGCVILKRLAGGADDWYVWHRSATSGNYLKLNSTNAQSSSSAANIFGNNTTTVDPTSTNFTVGNLAGVNASGSTYVAYLFAHDAGGFGPTGTDNVISCGSWTASSTAPVTVNLGWEPQYVLVKNASAVQDWFVWDTMRGMPVDLGQPYISPNLSSSESVDTYYLSPSATGFTVRTNALGSNGNTYIYMAIRRGPMRTPTSGRSVFEPTTYTGQVLNTNIGTMGPIDLFILGSRDAYGTAYSQFVFDRFRNNKGLGTANTDPETNFSNTVLKFDTMFGWNTNSSTTSYLNGSGYNYVSWNFKRAPGFFDMVAYTGTGVARTVPHGLGVPPELIIVRDRTISSGFGNWSVYSPVGGTTQYLYLNTSAALTTNTDYWNSTSPTSSVFTVGTNRNVNANGDTHVAYLFASCPGVSKVGSYTGTGSAQTIDCGFTGGARFVLIKRTDSTGQWYVWDTARGIVTGNDPYLLLNSNSAEVTATNYISPQSVGFGLTATAPSDINGSGGTYIFLAIA